MKSNLLDKIVKFGISFLMSFGIITLFNSFLFMHIETRGYIYKAEIVLLSVSYLFALVFYLVWQFYILKDLKLKK